MEKKIATFIAVALLLIAAIPVSSTLASSVLQNSTQGCVSDGSQTCDRERLMERDRLQLNASVCSGFMLQRQAEEHVRSEEQCTHRVNQNEYGANFQMGNSLELANMLNNMLQSKAMFGYAKWLGTDDALPYP